MEKYSFSSEGNNCVKDAIDWIFLSANFGEHDIPKVKN